MRRRRWQATVGVSVRVRVRVGRWLCHRLQLRPSIFDSLSCLSLSMGSLRERTFLSFFSPSFFFLPSPSLFPSLTALRLLWTGAVLRQERRHGAHTDSDSDTDTPSQSVTPTDGQTCGIQADTVTGTGRCLLHSLDWYLVTRCHGTQTQTLLAGNGDTALYEAFGRILLCVFPSFLTASTATARGREGERARGCDSNAYDDFHLDGESGRVFGRSDDQSDRYLASVFEMN